MLKTLGIEAVAAAAGYAIAKRANRPSKRIRGSTSDPPAAGETNNYTLNLTYNDNSVRRVHNDHRRYNRPITISGI
jgi:hypothetical protein